MPKPAAAPVTEPTTVVPAEPTTATLTATGASAPGPAPHARRTRRWAALAIVAYVLLVGSWLPCGCR